MGELRLTALIALLMALVKAEGIVGAVTAFLLYNALFMSTALIIIGESVKQPMTIWCMRTAFISLNYVIPVNEALAAAMFTLL